MKNKKAQIGIEFIIIIGALMFFVALFILTIYETNEEELYEKENILLKDIALSVQNEIYLAMEASDGYNRDFEIPDKAGNLEYDITVDNKIIYIQTIPSKHALTVPCLEVVGDINKTHNTITKISGVVYLNQ